MSEYLTSTFDIQYSIFCGSLFLYLKPYTVYLVLLPIQLNRLYFSPTRISESIVNLSLAQIHDNGQVGDDLPHRFNCRVPVDTDGKWLVHVVFENILNPRDIYLPLYFGHTLAGSAAAKIG